MTRQSARERIIAELNRYNWSIENVRWILSKMENEYKAPPKASLIEAAAEACGTTPEMMKEPNERGRLSRKREAVIARQLVFFELVNQGKTLYQAGSAFNQDHTTVIHGVKQIKNGLEVKWKPITEAYNKFQDLLHGENLHTLHNEEERAESL